MTWLDTEGNRDWRADAQELLEQDVFGSGVIMSDEFFPDAPSHDPNFWNCGCDCSECFYSPDHEPCKYGCWA